MIINDIPVYLKYLSTKNRLMKVKDQVSAELEITAFTDKACKENKYDAKTLFFENVQGYDMPVVTNLFGSIDSMKEIFKESYFLELISSFNSQDSKISLLKGAQTLSNSKPKIIDFNKRNYVSVDSLDALPILKVWPKDAAKFITLPIVVTLSPEDKSLNAGIYRMQLYDSMTTGMHWQSQKGGSLHAYEAAQKNKELLVSVAIGSDPYNIVSAVAPLPQGFNEFSFAGIVRGSKSILVKNGEYPPVPSNSEIIIYGTVDPNELRKEGPFGDHTGYYSIPEQMNVLHIKQIYSKKNPIYAASVVGFPWHEDAAIGKFMLEYLKPLIKKVNDSIIDIYLPPEGLFTSMCFIKVKKRFAGEAKKAMFSILGLGQLSFMKIIVAFDEDIDITDFSSTMWALSTRVEPERDIQIIKGAPLDTLDHTTNTSAYGSKVIIDATKKSKAEGYFREWPDTIEMQKDITDLVDKKWKQVKF